MDVTEIEPVNVEKVAEENPQSRFRVLDTAILKPGVCALCGSAGGDGRQFVDFGKTMDWYGCVYFCTFCVAEAATLIGFAPEANWTLAERNLQDEISVGDDRYVEAKVKLDAAMVLLRDHLNGDCGTVTYPVEIAEVDVVDDRDSEPEPEPSNGDESDADESDPLQGSDDVSADSSRDDGADAKPVRRTRKSAG